MKEEKTLRLFKVEFDGQEPTITTGDILLEIAKEWSSEEIPFEGSTIDDAFKHLRDYDSIQECDLPEDLASIHKQLRAKEEEVRVLKSKRLNMFEHLEIVQKNRDLESKLEVAVDALKRMDSVECAYYDIVHPALEQIEVSSFYYTL